MEYTTTGMDRQTHEILDHIVRSLFNAGYDPYEQLIGYTKTGDAAYITRKGNARALIHSIPIAQVQQYADALPRPSRT